jgi:Tfp pilus assembly protein PilF
VRAGGRGRVATQPANPQERPQKGPSIPMPTAKELLDEAWRWHQQGQPVQAEQAYRYILDHVPNYANAWFFLGIVLHDQQRFGEAIEAYQRALQIRPEFPSAWNNLGNSLRFAFRADEAEACFQSALRLKPDYVIALKNRGTLHVWTGQHELARSCYESALRLAPDDPDLHRNLGLLSLRQGDFRRGWQEYRWRWRCPDLPRPVHHQPVWNGEPLADKTVLLYAEQGLGDAIQFVRFASVVQRLGARTIFHCADGLVPLLQSCEGIDCCLPQSRNIDLPFDYHCSLIDVAAQVVQDLSDIPSPVPYLQPSKPLVEQWRAWVDGLPPSRLRVGIVWQGNRGQQTDVFRSVPLSVLKPLGEIDSIQLISLQHGFGSEQLSGWQGGNRIWTLPEHVDREAGSFMDTAAILAHLDLVITPDTAMAHLAGALGRPAWLLLSYMPDWRWFMDRPDSPWYPTLRLFRQPSQGDWPSVVRKVTEALVEAGVETLRR